MTAKCNVIEEREGQEELVAGLHLFESVKLDQLLQKAPFVHRFIVSEDKIQHFKVVFPQWQDTSLLLQHSRL